VAVSRPEAFGEIDELQNLRLKRPAACGGEIDRRLELDRAGRPARQRCGPLLQQTAIDQQNELGAIALPGHSCGDRRRQQRGAGAGSGCDVARRRLDPRRTVHGDLQQEEALQTAGVDRHRPAIGDIVDGQSAKERAVMQRKKVGRCPVLGRKSVRAEYPPDRIGGIVDAAGRNAVERRQPGGGVMLGNAGRSRHGPALRII